MNDETRLKGEYLTAYNKTEKYIQFYSNFNKIDNVCLIEINDLLLIAQENNQPVTDVLGSDLKEFVSNIYDAYYPFSFTKYIYFRHTFGMFVAIFVIIIFDLLNKFDLHTLELSYLNLYVSTWIVRIIADLAKVLTKLVTKRSDNLLNLFTSKRTIFIFQFIFYFIYFILITNISMKISISPLLFVLTFLISVVPGIVYLILNNKKDSYSNESKSFNQSFIESIEKKYEKKNEKLVIKNEMTYSDKSLAKHLKFIYRIYDLVTPVVLLMYIALFVFIIQLQLETSFSPGGIITSIFILLIIYLFTTYYHSKKIIYAYIRQLEKRDLPIFEKGITYDNI